jgi:hypothetical protein
VGTQKWVTTILMKVKEEVNKQWDDGFLEVVKYPQ